LDGDDEMMAHMFIEEEVNVRANEGEHFHDSRTLGQLHAEENAAPNHGGL
jgi:hypothetical protein